MAGDTVQITMPQMGESVSEGTVLTWHKQEGDWVEKDETIVEVSTDKVDAEVPRPPSGKLVKILAQEDETVEVGQPLGGARARRGARRRRRGARRRSRPPSPPQAATASSRPQRRRADRDGRRRRPRRRRRARRSRGASPPRTASTSTQVSGTGTGGRVVKEDVLALRRAQRRRRRRRRRGARRRRRGRSAGADEPQPMRGADAVLARYMTESLAIPTATSFRTLAVDDARRAAGAS